MALFLAWFTIDGCYWLYWSVVTPDALFMRSANAYASTFLYLLMGMVWMYPGSLGELLSETMRTFRVRGRSGAGDR